MGATVVDYLELARANFLRGSKVKLGCGTTPVDQGNCCGLQIRCTNLTAGFVETSPCFHWASTLRGGTL
jgi:hypothetical protein